MIRHTLYVLLKGDKTTEASKSSLAASPIRRGKMCELCLWTTGIYGPLLPPPRRLCVKPTKLWWRLLLDGQPLSAIVLAVLGGWRQSGPPAVSATVCQACMHLFSCPLGQVNKNSVNLCRHRLKDYYCNFMTVYVCVPTQIQKDKYLPTHTLIHTLWQKWLREVICQIQHEDTRCKLALWDRQSHGSWTG